MIREASRVLLTRRALILGKIESTYNVDANPSPSTDAALVSEPDYAVDANVLTRNFVREDISPLGSRVGRKLASLSFGMEFRSNGNTDSGSLSDESMVGRFLRACGYSVSGMTGTGTVGSVKNTTGNTVNPSGWAVGGASTLLNKAKYTITCVLGGASATAKLRVSGGEIVDDATVLPNEGVTAEVTGSGATVTATVDQSDPLAVDVTIGGVFHVGDVVTVVVCGVEFNLTVTSGMTNLNGIATALATLIDAHALITASPSSAVVTIGYAGLAAGVVVTSGSTALTIGDSDVTLTPTWTGNLTLGDSWTVYVYPVGLKYLPVSEDFESITLEAYFDGVMHKITGAFGTFSITANAGEYATINFTFTGQYHAPEDADVPAATHETALPAIVELARLWLGDSDFKPVVNAFTFDQANTIVPRPDVNSTDGYIGVRLTNRAPTGGIDPEATLVADYDWWGKMASSEEIAFSMRIGSTAGNIICMNAPKIQYTGLTYQSRDDIRVYDAGISFGRDQGNDEMEFVFA